MNRIVLALLITGFAALSPAPTATAAPPGFPDVNAFVPVDPQPHIYRHYRNGDYGDMSALDRLVKFSTPDGVSCFYNYILPAAANPALNAGINCWGNIPGIPDAVPDSGGPGCAKVSWAFLSNEFVLDRHGGHCPPFPAGIGVLNPGQKIETGNATCMVGEGALVACVDPTKDRGFVLQPSGSWVF